MPESRATEVAGELVLGESVHDEMVAHCLRSYPLEGCGLLVGEPSTATVAWCAATRNAAASARVYEVDPRDLLHVDRAAEQAGQSLLGVFHSHTHTDAYPSPTDVAQAPDPSWHYVIVSLRAERPSLRSYRILEGKILEESVVLRSD
jgi:proteasome lid subunit RPN8/RPN11